MRVRIAYLGLAGAIACWGASFRIGHALAAHLSPWTLTTWRYTWAALLLTAVARSIEGERAGVPRAALPRVIAMGVLGHAAFSLCFFYGLRGTAPATAAVISGLEPLVVMLMGSAYFRQRLPLRLGPGIAASVCGALLASHTGASSQPLGWLGPALMALSTACFGAYTLLGREVLAHMSPLAMTAATMRWTLPALWALSWLREGAAMLAVPSPGDLVRLAFFVLGVTVAAFVGWNLALQRLGINRTAIWGNGIPVVGALVDGLHGAALHGSQWLGLALVVWGVVHVQRLEALRSARSP